MAIAAKLCCEEGSRDEGRDIFWKPNKRRQPVSHGSKRLESALFRFRFAVLALSTTCDFISAAWFHAILKTR